MKNTVLVLLLALTIALSPQPVKADYQYTFYFDEFSSGSVYFPADSFSFITTNIMVPPEYVEVPGEELNGFSFSSLMLNDVGTYFAFATNEPEPLPGYIGQILNLGIFIKHDLGPLDVGTYPTDATRSHPYSLDPMRISIGWAPGTLTISSVSAVPEPATMLLLGLGLVGLARIRRNIQ